MATLSSCGPGEVDPANSTSGEIYKPVLMPRSQLENSVAWLAARDLNRPGRIYAKGDTIYVCERYSGIHVIKNTDPKNPVPLGFIRIPGNQDLAIKGNILYADNAVDLLAIDLSALPSIRITQRIRGCFPSINPPSNLTSSYLGNIPSDAVVVGWEKSK